jgi:hypothetical protein
MATEALKVTSITNLDAMPPVRTTHLGQDVQRFETTITATTAMSSGSTYKLLRLPSNAILHNLAVWLDATVTTFTGDITLYYSDTWADGTDANAGLGLVTAHVFQTAYAFGAQVTPAEVLLGGNIKGASLGEPLWQMAALTADPGGFFDVTIVTTTTTSGAPVINCQATWGVN